MSDDLPENVAPTVASTVPSTVPSGGGGAAVLRREALLPNERSRGLGTVAVVCTMAGVASGLALATTLMAMQVADSMSSRGCPYRESQTSLQVDTRGDHGFLGVSYAFHDGYADVYTVIPGTPAEAIELRRHDHVLSVDNVRIRSQADLYERIFAMAPGDRPSIVIEREGEVITMRPTLIAWPTITY